MLLLDKNTTPENTVYYLSGIVDGLVKQHNGIDIIGLYQKLQKEIRNIVNFDFFMLALDFLFLVERIRIDSKGGIHDVHKNTCDKKHN